MQKPPYLNKGDKIVILSTARKISKEEIQTAVDEINSWGLNVVFGANLHEEDHQFSGSKAQRIVDFQTALDDKSVKAILCARGGYGTVQLIDELDFTQFCESPKWVIGYSDVTVLHNHINQNYNVQTLHATMPINFPTNTKESIQSLKKVLFDEKIQHVFPSSKLNINGKAAGELVGGNLSIIYSLTGTLSQINTKGKILFIEDLDEYIYHIDRMMMNLKRAGMLSDLAGLIVGGMSDMNDNAIPYGKNAKEIILDAVKEYNYPVCFDFPAGHLDDNRALVFGSKVLLEVGEECVLKMNEL
jgi:muramoyltetrapeptide carboxypeptidase